MADARGAGTFEGTGKSAAQGPEQGSCVGIAAAARERGIGWGILRAAPERGIGRGIGRQGRGTARGTA